MINSIDEWINVVSTPGVISKAADDADAIGTVAFQFNGNTYVAESVDSFDNNTANVTLTNIVELTGLTGVAAVVTTAADNSILIA